MNNYQQYRAPAVKLPYTGDGLEVVRNLTPDTAPSSVLADVARWHRSAWRQHDARHIKIAEQIELVS